MVHKWPFYGHFKIWVKKFSFPNCKIYFGFTGWVFKLYMIVLGLYTYFKPNFHNMVQKKLCAIFWPFFCHFCHFDHFDRHDYSAVINISPLPSYQNIMVLNILTRFQSAFCHKWPFFAIFWPKNAIWLKVQFLVVKIKIWDHFSIVIGA